MTRRELVREAAARVARTSAGALKGLQVVLALASDQEAAMEFRGPPEADRGLAAEERFSHQVLAPVVNRFLGAAPRADFQAVLADILAVVLAVAVGVEMAAREEQALAAARAQAVVK